ncbi:MAG: magnesium transporter [Candidatus Kapaibacterium sp.]
MPPEQNENILEVDDELLNDLRRLMETGDDNALRALLIDLHESDVAHLLEFLSEEERHYILSLLRDEVVGEVMLHLPEEQREDYLAELAPERISHIVEELSTDDAADLVSELSDEVAEEVLQNLQRSDQEATDEIRDLLRYDENTAGGRMTTDYVAVEATETVAASIEKIREFVREMELEVYVLYVVDAEYRLAGIVRLQDLVLRPPGAVVESFMLSDLITVAPNEDQSVVAQVMQRYDLIAVPVIADSGELLGIVTFDDIADIIDEEASQDMLSLAGITDEESLATPPLRSLRRRLPWLAINLGTAFLAAMVVDQFQGTIARVAVLASLMSIVAGEGGNAAIQTITVIVRSIALGEIRSGHLRHAVIKEGKVAVLNGLAMGLLTGVLVWLMWGKYQFGVLIAIAMLVNLIVAGVVGALIPLGLRKLRLDPALSSGPIVTTFTDVCGYFIFLGLATLTMNWLLK